MLNNRSGDGGDEPRLLPLARRTYEHEDSQEIDLHGR
jgi:hypothetical protein